MEAKGKYEGDLINGKKQGKGTYTWPNGNKYIGEWKDNIINGKGEFIFNTGAKYNGNWKNNKFDGEGEFIWTNGDRYNGNWQNGKKNGHGIFYYSDGDVYDGEWNNDMKEGKGKLTYKNGTIFEGTWKGDKRDGEGVFKNAIVNVEYNDGQAYDNNPEYSEEGRKDRSGNHDEPKTRRACAVRGSSSSRAAMGSERAISPAPTGTLTKTAYRRQAPRTPSIPALSFCP